MDVAVSALRADLSTWLDRVRNGAEVVITDRGTPVARLTPVETASLIDQLTRDGVLAKPRSARRPHAGSTKRVSASGPVAELVAEQRH